MHKILPKYIYYDIIIYNLIIIITIIYNNNYYYLFLLYIERRDGSHPYKNHFIKFRFKKLIIWNVFILQILIVNRIQVRKLIENNMI